MEAGDRIGEVTVTRYIDHERGALIARGRFDSFLAGYLDHVRRWELEPDGLSWALMRQGLAGTVLHLSCRPVDESVGFTLNIARPPLNVFLTGDAATSAVTGRAVSEGVRTAGSSRLFVQAHRPQVPLMESVIEVRGYDVLEILEEYYRRSEQTPARFFEYDEDRFLMVLTLPDGRRDQVEDLTRETAAAFLAGGHRLLDTRVFRFQCGCTPEKMMTALRTLFGARPEELFAGDAGVEVFCPRCGTRWWIEREAFGG